MGFIAPDEATMAENPASAGPKESQEGVGDSCSPVSAMAVHIRGGEAHRLTRRSTGASQLPDDGIHGWERPYFSLMRGLGEALSCSAPIWCLSAERLSHQGR